MTLRDEKINRWMHAAAAAAEDRLDDGRKYDVGLLCEDSVTSSETRATATGDGSRRDNEVTGQSHS